MSQIIFSYRINRLQEQLFALTRSPASLTRSIIILHGSTRENAIRANLALSLVCLLASFLMKGGEDGFRDYAEFIRREWDAGTAVTISRIRAPAINKDAGTGSAL